ncbi:hypothetical protein Celaphus_00007412 [Cervus elaphus hippelaphus]|uniref:Uncharacterized protein n=1 Tax=Cervus elaphus hippelaphus TaxID=46360 RepID=A0A212CBB2_CEREH|nr:hypothetical protein Celaphus_00007412 [Cervus elaphus hippelaphus]
MDAQVSSAVFQLKRITEGIPERPPHHSGCPRSSSFRTMARHWASVASQPDSAAPGPSHSGASLLSRFFEALSTRRALLLPT